jgi:hypothetical protein
MNYDKRKWERRREWQINIQGKTNERINRKKAVMNGRNK